LGDYAVSAIIPAGKRDAILSTIKNYYIKYKEQLLYIVFGAATTLINWIVYTLFLFVVPFQISNAIAWFLSVLFAYFVNKMFVFESKFISVKQTIKEMALFYGARMLSGVFEIAGLPFLVFLGLNQQVFGIEAAFAKVIISVIVIVLNYFFSKFVVFRKKQE